MYIHLMGINYFSGHTHKLKIPSSNLMRSVKHFNQIFIAENIPILQKNILFSNTRTKHSV